MSRILVIEDDRDIRELIAFSLRYAGLEVETAGSGMEGLAKVADTKPDLILLDVRMPKLTGYEVCQKLKADASTEDIPVVFLSARGQEADIQHGLTLGAEDYILKPFSPDELPGQIQTILTRVRNRISSREQP